METLNNFLIYALQSPKKRHNLYVGQTDNYKRRMKLIKAKIVVVLLYETLSKNTAGKTSSGSFDGRFDAGRGKSLGNSIIIARFDCMAPKGYNLTSGGDNRLASQITKDRMSVSGKAAWTIPEVKAKRAASAVGGTE